MEWLNVKFILPTVGITASRRAVQHHHLCLENHSSLLNVSLLSALIRPVHSHPGSVGSTSGNYRRKTLLWGNHLLVCLTLLGLHRDYRSIPQGSFILQTFPRKAWIVPITILYQIHLTTIRRAHYLIYIPANGLYSDFCSPVA